MFNIGDLVEFKQPHIIKTFGVIKQILEIKESENIEDVNKIIYKVQSLDERLGIFEVECLEITKVYTKVFDNTILKL